MEPTKPSKLARTKVAALNVIKMIKQQGDSTKKHAVPDIATALPTERKKFDLNLPPADNPETPAEFACMTETAVSDFPVPTFTKTDFNVNAKHGGGTALVILTELKLTLQTFTSELGLIRCGVGGNHYGYTPLVRSGEHSQYRYVEIHTDRNGNVAPCQRFGSSRATIVSNIPRMGNCGCVAIYNMPDETHDSAGKATLQTDISIGPGEYGKALLVICSADGKSDSNPCNAYFVCMKHKDGEFNKHTVAGKDCDDLWSFSCSSDQCLSITGPSQSKYGIWNCDGGESNNERLGKFGKVLHAQTHHGSKKVIILENLSTYIGHALLVLCSCSTGVDDETTSALYLVNVKGGGIRRSFVAGISGSGSSGNDWEILEDEDRLWIVGPEAPCRYSILSNIHEDITDPKERCFQDSCLVTGRMVGYRGAVFINGVTITGWVSESSRVRILLNGLTIEMVEEHQLLEQPDGRLGFQRVLNDDENGPGLKLIQVFGLTNDINDQSVSVELEGSPHRIVQQPQGVLYAINLGGPTYEALNKVVFSGIQKTYRTAEKSKMGVFQYLLPRGRKHNLYNMMANTNDGFLFSTCYSTHPEYADEMSFDLPVGKTGDLTMKLYSVSNYLKRQIIRINYDRQNQNEPDDPIDFCTFDEDSDVDTNGEDDEDDEDIPSTPMKQPDAHFISSEVDKQLDAIPEVIPNFTAKVVSIPFTTEREDINVYFRNVSTGNSEVGTGCKPAAIMVHDDTYNEPVPSNEQLAEENQMKQKLADTLIPLDRSINMKQIKIAGWSSNLLVNPSGENRDMSYWNYGGDWNVLDGGDQTETLFVSSYMTCTKSQEVNLTTFFSDEHLDSSPVIQVSESFHEGCNKGGLYSMTASLMKLDGTVVAKQTVGEMVDIKTSGWIRVCFTFKDYGPEVRFVSIETKARDQMTWAGFFGARCSAACIRVKSEIKTASGDSYTDIQPISGANLNRQLDSMVRGLYENHKADLKELQHSMEEREEQQSRTVNTSDEHLKADVKPSFKLKEGIKRKKREIRIFVSSTFRDFQEEREVLIKKAFRELNRICLDRGVFFTYVDLRWGITEAQTCDGQTISICLREIEKCRPYFICLLGDRYGWSQSKTNPDKLLDKSYNYAIDNYDALKWISQYRYETSVTKLEVLHGALNDMKSTKQRIFFYLREPRIKREDLPPPDLPVVKQDATNPDAKPKKTDEEVKDTPKSNAEKEKEAQKRGETQWHFDRQQLLRSAVESSGIATRRYTSADDGCELVRKDILWCLDEDFPPGTKLSSLQREYEAHQAFADPRRRIYIGGSKYMKEIDNYDQSIVNGTDDESPNVPLVILGESGSGKSALIANWSQRYQEKYTDVFMFVHFIGSSSESASHLNLLRRLYGEMKNFFGFGMAVPSSHRNLVLELSSWLQMAAKQTKVVLVLDALNQLDSGIGTGDEQDLKWIPRELPRNVCMVVSTLPGRAMEAVIAARWPTIKVYPLDVDEKSDIVTGYLKLYAKSLNDEQRELIIDAQQTNNPLYLKALLDEVRMYGSFFQLTTAIKAYLAAGSPGELFVKILERFEDDFEQGIVERPGLVRDATCALWCSHRGLSERELTQFLKVPGKVWSPFYFSLEENLVNRNGIVNFFHDHLRQAVERKYLSTPELKQEAFLALANWFNSQDIDDRYVDEVPYCLARANEMSRLRATILNVAVFERLMATEDGQFQLIKSWQLLGGYEEVEQAYLDVLKRSENWGLTTHKDDLIRVMAGFFMQLGLLKGARLLNERLLNELEDRYIDTHAAIIYHYVNHDFKTKCVHSDVLDVLISLGVVSIKLGDLDSAKSYFHEAIQRQNRVKTPDQKLRLVKALLGLGSVFSSQGSADEAIRFLRRAEELATDVLGPKHHYIAAINGQIAQLYYNQSKLDDAMLLHLWDLKLTQADVGLNHPRVAAVLNNCGLVLDDMNNPMSGSVFQAVLAILMEAYGRDHVDVATVRFNLGAHFLASNVYQRAKYQFDEALRIFELFLEGNHPNIKATRHALEKLK